MAKVGNEKLPLIDRFKQRQALEMEEVEQSMKQGLTQLSETLTQHVSDELSTTKSAIAAQSEAISSLLKDQSQSLNSQRMILEDMKSLTQSETKQIKQELIRELQKIQAEAMSDLKQVQSQALKDLQETQSKTLQQVYKMQHSLINDSIAPMKESMATVRKEGEALSKIALRAWLKPLLVSVAVTVGVGAALFLTAGALFQYHSYEIAKLAVLNGKVREARQVLSQLPEGVEFVVEDGKKYLFSKKISAPVDYQGKQFVEIE